MLASVTSVTVLTTDDCSGLSDLNAVSAETASTLMADEQVMAALTAHGTLCVEMEAAALYAVADAERGRALTIVTISDHLPRHEQLTAQEREDCFLNMTKVALQAVASPSVA